MHWVVTLKNHLENDVGPFRENVANATFFLCVTLAIQKNKTNKLRSRAHGSSTSNQWLIATVKVLTGLDKKTISSRQMPRVQKGAHYHEKIERQKTTINEIEGKM